MKSSSTHLIHERNWSKGHDDHDSSDSDSCILGFFLTESRISEDVSRVVKYCIDPRELLRQLHYNSNHERSPQVSITQNRPHWTPFNDWGWRSRVSRTLFMMIMMIVRWGRWATIHVLMSRGSCSLILMMLLLLQVMLMMTGRDGIVIQEGSFPLRRDWSLLLFRWGWTTWQSPQTWSPQDHSWSSRWSSWLFHPHLFDVVVHFRSTA